MPIKILLADKSITIQKVVEMLFSGKEYEVVCVSDGETALSEAGRIRPDVVLADIDLPRVDGYSFSARLKETVQSPVILMMSRDDVFDQAKARQAGISDHIAKPFESQELISKVRKAAAAAPARPAQAAAEPPRTTAAKPQAPPSRPAAAAPREPAKEKPKQAAPADIFEIIEEAPTHADLKHDVIDDEGVYEVEPVIEVEEEQTPAELSSELPVGEKAVEELRQGLGIAGKSLPEDQEIVSFESLDSGTVGSRQKAAPVREERLPEAREWKPVPSAGQIPQRPPQAAGPSESDLWSMAEAAVTKAAREMAAKTPQFQPPVVSIDEVRAMAEQAVSAMAKNFFAEAPPRVPDDVVRSIVEQAVQDSVSGMVRELAQGIIEKVAWEVVPDLAAALIKAEIERLKAEP